MDSVTDPLIRSLNRASDRELGRGRHIAVGSDQYSRDYITIKDVLHYATQHYKHHRRQLTLTNAINE